MQRLPSVSSGQECWVRMTEGIGMDSVSVQMTSKA